MTDTKYIRDGDPGRLDFLPRQFGVRGMLLVESLVYDYAREAIEQYHGGLWTFCEASNGAGYMVPPPTLPDTVTLRPVRGGQFGREVRGVSLDGAGLALTVMACNHASWTLSRRGDDAGCAVLVDAFDRLMDAVAAHPDAGRLCLYLD